ncbi:hypothetical protein DPMN_169421 [Dreissena polymorpha]|uniref:Laminin G domain-containing protein n=1 Tax=Dreissena polymorpha TaxID=45954 RepID=A0A9D4DXS0_DREPO|nr:hypothetical protein DPMN_169421 [Dreissena polymorpha]
MFNLSLCSQLVKGRVQVLYNLGGQDGESALTLARAPASNGQWHTVSLRRIGRWFELKMDDGEGRYRNTTWGPIGGRELITIDMYGIVSGAHVVFSNNPIVDSLDLNQSEFAFISEGFLSSFRCCLLLE